MRSKAKKLTRREKALFAGLAKGLTVADAARNAGYSQKWPTQSGAQALRNIVAKDPGLFERHGLDDDSFISKHIIPALNAMETEFFSQRGKIISTRRVIAWGPRILMITLIAKMKGLIGQEQQNSAPGVKFLVINAENRPPRPLQSCEAAKMSELPSSWVRTGGLDPLIK